MIFWDSSQKLWNRRLLSFFRKMLPKRLFWIVKRIIIWIDSLLLIFMVLKRRVKRPNNHVFKKINYFDIGTHKEAQELRSVYEKFFINSNSECNFYAFEAFPDYYKNAKTRLDMIPNLIFFNLALVFEVPDSGVLKFYLTENSGLGNSIFKTDDSNPSVIVKASKLSDIIHEEQIDLENSLNIIRMNIEGSEFDILKDLDETGLLKHFTGYYGMWDDIQKNPAYNAEKFKQMREHYKIDNFTYNGRDLKFPLREKWILKDIKDLVKKNLSSD